MNTCKALSFILKNDNNDSFDEQLDSFLMLANCPSFPNTTSRSSKTFFDKLSFYEFYYIVFFVGFNEHQQQIQRIFLILHLLVIYVILG
jgi:hypothetical protein